MKVLAKLLFCLTLGVASLNAAAQPQRVFNQAELDALLAPIALYPDAVVSQILTAAIYPEQVHEAARWSRANPHLRGEEAVRTVQAMPWDESVKALLAFPDLLARMDESPQWLRDLGDAFLAHEPYVMETIQSLRQRAQTSGYLRSDGERLVYEQGEAIVVQPAHPQVVYVRYYDPLIVFGSWWWPAHHPVHWRPWPAHRVFFTTTRFAHASPWQHRALQLRKQAPAARHVAPAPIAVRPAPAPARPHSVTRPSAPAPEALRRPIISSTPQAISTPQVQAPHRLGAVRERIDRRNGPPSPAAQMQKQQFIQRSLAQPQAQRGEVRMPAARGFSPWRGDRDGERRREAPHRNAGRR